MARCYVVLSSLLLFSVVSFITLPTRIPFSKPLSSRCPSLKTATGTCPEWSSKIGEVLFTHEQINARILELGKEITEFYRKPENSGTELVVIGLLKGSVLFLADLIRHIAVPYKLDFMAVSSYSGTSSTGNIKVKKDLDVDPLDKHILIVEDLIDTGNTLAWLSDMLKSKKPRSVRICTLLDKHECRIAKVPIDFCGFPCENKFVVGYGMDFNEDFRCIPFVGVLKPEAYAKGGPAH